MARPAGGYTDSSGTKVLGSTSVLKSLSFIDPDALCRWAVRCHQQGSTFVKVRSEAGKTGSILHDLCETRLPHALDPVADRPIQFQVPTEPKSAAFLPAWEKVRDELNKKWTNMLQSYAAIREWYVRYGPVVFFHEEPLISEGFKFAGTPDAVATFPRDIEHGPDAPWLPLGVRIVAGRPWLFDYKTGRLVGAKEVCQMASYRQLLRETRGIEVDGAILLHAPTVEPGHVRPVVLSSSVLDAGWEAFRCGLAVAKLTPTLAAATEA